MGYVAVQQYGQIFKFGAGTDLVLLDLEGDGPTTLLFVILDAVIISLGGFGGRLGLGLGVAAVVCQHLIMMTTLSIYRVTLVVEYLGLLT